MLIPVGTARASGYNAAMAKPPGPLKIKTQILCGDEIAMGPGKADLLEAIAREGSISAAGRALGMSYRRAWMLVDAMNRCWEEQLVLTTGGGKQGGGARVSPAGFAVLDAYRSLQGKLARTGSGAAGDAAVTLLRAAPLARKPGTADAPADS